MGLLAAIDPRKMLARRAGVGLLLCLLALASAWAAAVSVPLRGAWRNARPGDTPAMVLDQFRAGSLTPFDPGQLQRFPSGDLGSWVVLQAAPPWVQEDRVLAIYPPTLGSITYFARGERAHHLALDDFNAPTHGHGRLAIPLPANVPESDPILLRFEPGDGMAAPVSFQLEPVAAYYARDSRWLVYASACFAVMLAMALMALCFALMLLDSTFTWYAGYILCYALIQGVQTGFLFHPLEFEWLADSELLLGQVAVAMSVAFAAMFMARFCELQRFAPLLQVPVQALAISMPVLVMLRSSHVALLESTARMLINPLLMLAAILLLVAAILTAIRGSRHAWFFLGGWTPLLALTAASSAQVSGAMSGLNWINDAGLGAGAFEAMVLSLGLADRAMTIRRDRDIVRALANSDPLTNVLNRRAWSEAAGKLLAESSGRPLALMFLDLDRFKTLNDQQGHGAGDRALLAVANALRAELRPTDLLGRYGGEEFIAMLDGIVQEQAMQVATRLCRRVHRLEIPVSGDVLLSISIGITMRMPDDSLDSLIERADQAMYRAKANGRNQAQLFDRRQGGATNADWSPTSQTDSAA